MRGTRLGEIGRRGGVRGLSVALALLTLALPEGGAQAGSGERKGTGGGLELRIPVGPRGVALGGATAADEAGVEALYWNPAGIAGMGGTEILFSHTEYFAGMTLEYLALATPLGDFGSLGFQVKALSVGEILVTTEDAPDGTGEILDPTFTVMGVSYARRFTDRVQFGGTLNLATERIGNLSAGGVAFDLGVQYEAGWSGMKFGFVMKNFGTAMRFDGEDLETNMLPPSSDPTASNRTFRATTSKAELPSYFNISASLEALRRPDQRLSVLGAFQNNNFLGDDFRTGVEWSYKDLLALRGSYFWNVFTEDVDVETGESRTGVRGGDDLFDGYALGAGVNLRLGGATRASLDVTWRGVRQYFDDTLEFGVTLRL